MNDRSHRVSNPVLAVNLARDIVVGEEHRLMCMDVDPEYFHRVDRPDNIWEEDWCWAI